VGVRGSLTWLLGDVTAGHPRAVWEAAGVRSSAELERWQAAGAQAPSDVVAWKRVTDGPEEATGWWQRGLNPRQVNAWKGIVSGFDELDSWIRLGIVDIQDIHAWRSVCAGIDEVVRWQRLGVDATSARHWRHLGVDPSDRQRWARLGLRDVEAIAQWSQWGFDPAAARPWRFPRQRIAAEDAGAWHQHGFDFRRSRPWRRLGVTAADAAAFRDTHVRPLHARSWLRHEFKPAEICAWIEARISRRHAAAWRDLGVPAADARQWQQAFSTRKAAIPWLEEDIRSPEAARAWSERGRTPAEAKPWIDEGFSALEAEAWRLGTALGDGPDPAREAAAAAGWRARRFTPELCARWRPVVDDPGEARLWRRLVGEPDGVWPWRRAGVDDPSAAIRFSEAGMTPAEALAWTRLGVLGVDAIMRVRDRWTLTDAAQWCHALDCDLDRAWQWRQLAKDSLARATAWRLAGARVPEDAWGWVDAGYEPREVHGWIRAGMTGRAEVEGLRAAGVEADDLGRWRTIGVRPVARDITVWSERWSLDEAERWCQACDDDVAGAWQWAATVDHDIDAVTRWKAVGVDSHEVVHEAIGAAGADTAASALDLYEEMAAAGLTALQAFEWLEHLSPDEVLAWRRCGLTDHAAAAAWRDQQFTPEQCRRWRPAVDDPVRAHAWRDAVGEPTHVVPWRAAGVEDPAAADQFAAAGIQPKEVAAWDRLGAVGVDVVMRWRERWSLADALRWCGLLGCDLDQAWRWHELAGGRLSKASAWQAVGDGSPEAASAWSDTGFDADEVLAWTVAGISDRTEVEALAAAGLGPDDVDRWRRIGVGLSADELVAWSQRWPLDEAERWCEGARSDVVRAWKWAEAAAHHLDAVARWRVVGVDDPALIADAVAATGSDSPDAALRRVEELVAAGLPSATQGLSWLRAMSIDEMLGWLSIGFTDHAEALAWRTKGFTPDSCVAWRSVVDEPGIAGAWRRVVEVPEAVAMWRAAGTDDPRSAARLLELGIDPTEAIGWTELGVTGVDGIVLWRARWPLARATAWRDALACDLGRAWWWHRLADGDLDLARGWKDTHEATEQTASAES